MISFQCESCGQKMRVPPEKAGKKGKCRCGALITIPSDSSTANVAQALPDSQPGNDNSWLDDLPDAGPVPSPPPQAVHYQPAAQPAPTPTPQPAQISPPATRHASASEGMLEAYAETSRTAEKEPYTAFNNTVIAGVFFIGLAIFLLIGGFVFGGLTLGLLFLAFPLLLLVVGVVTTIVGLLVGR